MASSDHAVLWLTGLSGSGKSTIARALKPRLDEMGRRTETLDGDVVRKELSPDLGFTREDRETHARRVVYLCKLLSRNGILPVVSLISPYRAFRSYARIEIESSGSKFVEVYVKCALGSCIKRDPKGLYKKALAGEIKDMTGLQDPYEEPLNPDLVVDTDAQDLQTCVDAVLSRLERLSHVTYA
jgi:adenylylsulfate kinase